MSNAAPATSRAATSKRRRPAPPESAAPDSAAPGSAAPESAARGRQSASADPARLAVERLREVDGTLPRWRPSVGYRLALLLVAAAMLLLPLVYIALVAAVAGALYWHVVNDAAIFSGVRGSGAMKLALLAYAGPIVAGGVLLLFMVKPLFARRGAGPATVSVTRGQEPLLFEFVARLCRLVGSPEPRRIDVDCRVNASASFRRGMLSFLGDDLVLTVGLPLAAGLTTRQFAGVLAHEFGHFAQGGGMRLNYLVRRINGWFARVVYERDAWDEWLAGAARDGGHWLVMIFGGVAMLCVWASRRVLWVLMVVGGAISSAMSRQMEFDADRYAARVAGSGAFAGMTARLPVLGAAEQGAFHDLSQAWGEKRLGDDFAALVLANDRQIPPDVRERIAAASATASKSGWFDSHPSDAARIRAATRLNAEGVLGGPAGDAPASSLFADFAERCKLASVVMYREQLGDALRPEHLVPTQALVAAEEGRGEQFVALRRCYQGAFNPVRPVFPDRAAAAETVDPSEAAEALLALRSKVVDRAARASKSVGAWAKADARLARLREVRTLLAAGVRVRASDFELPGVSADELQQAREEATASRTAAGDALLKAVATANRRVELALALAASVRPAASVATMATASDDSADADDFGEYDLSDGDGPAGSRGSPGDAAVGGASRLFDALDALRLAAPGVGRCRDAYQALAVLLAQYRPNATPEGVVGGIVSRAKALRQELADVHDLIRRTAYPYEHNERGATLATFCLPAVPGPQDVGGVAGSAEHLMESAYGLHARLTADLCARCEAAEASIGLPPLPEPPAARAL